MPSVVRQPLGRRSNCTPQVPARMVLDSRSGSSWTFSASQMDRRHKIWLGPFSKAVTDRPRSHECASKGSFRSRGRVSRRKANAGAALTSSDNECAQGTQGIAPGVCSLTVFSPSICEARLVSSLTPEAQMLRCQVLQESAGYQCSQFLGAIRLPVPEGAAHVARKSLYASYDNRSTRPRGNICSTQFACSCDALPCDILSYLSSLKTFQCTQPTQPAQPAQSSSLCAALAGTLFGL